MVDRSTMDDYGGDWEAELGNGMDAGFDDYMSAPAPAPAPAPASAPAPRPAQRGGRQAGAGKAEQRPTSKFGSGGGLVSRIGAGKAAVGATSLIRKLGKSSGSAQQAKPSSSGGGSSSASQGPASLSMHSTKSGTLQLNPATGSFEQAGGKQRQAPRQSAGIAAASWRSAGAAPSPAPAPAAHRTPAGAPAASSSAPYSKPTNPWQQRKAAQLAEARNPGYPASRARQFTAEEKAERRRQRREESRLRGCRSAGTLWVRLPNGKIVSDGQLAADRAKAAREREEKEKEQKQGAEEQGEEGHRGGAGVAHPSPKHGAASHHGSGSPRSHHSHHSHHSEHSPAAGSQPVGGSSAFGEHSSSADDQDPREQGLGDVATQSPFDASPAADSGTGGMQLGALGAVPTLPGGSPHVGDTQGVSLLSGGAGAGVGGAQSSSSGVFGGGASPQMTPDAAPFRPPLHGGSLGPSAVSAGASAGVTAAQGVTSAAQSLGAVGGGAQWGVVGSPGTAAVGWGAAPTTLPPQHAGWGAAGYAMQAQPMGGVGLPMQQQAGFTHGMALGGVDGSAGGTFAQGSVGMGAGVGMSVGMGMGMGMAPGMGMGGSLPMMAQPQPHQHHHQHQHQQHQQQHQHPQSAYAHGLPSYSGGIQHVTPAGGAPAFLPLQHGVHAQGSAARAGTGLDHFKQGAGGGAGQGSTGGGSDGSSWQAYQQSQQAGSGGRRPVVSSAAAGDPRSMPRVSAEPSGEGQ